MLRSPYLRVHFRACAAASVTVSVMCRIRGWWMFACRLGQSARLFTFHAAVIAATVVFGPYDLVMASPQTTYSPTTLPSFGNFHLQSPVVPPNVSRLAPLLPPSIGTSSSGLPQRISLSNATAGTPAAGDFQSCDSTADEPPQAIIDLAGGLKNDPGLIFHYVHDNIDLDLSVESSKGALGTYLDQSGSSFDQAALLLALLQSAATSNSQIKNPRIVIGLQRVTAAQFGLASLTSAMLTDAGDDPSWASSSLMPYAWVQVTINGSTVVMDPAGKTYSIISGSSLASYQPTAPSQTSTSIDNYLKSFSTNIYTAPSQQNYGSLVDLIGGRRIQITPTSTNYNQYGRPTASAAGNVSGTAPSSTPYTYSFMPFSFRTVMEVQLVPDSKNDKASGNVCTDQMYGHDVLMYFTSFLIDGVTVYTGNGNTSQSADVFTMVHQAWNSQGSLTNPWPQAATEPFSSLSNAVLAMSVGRVSAFRAQEMANLTELAEAPSGASAVVKLLSIGASELSQTSRGTDLLDQLAGTYTNNHHTVQFEHFTSVNIYTLGATSYVGVDTPLTATSVDVANSSPPSGLSVSPNAVAYALSTLQSAQEASALAQANVASPVSAATLIGTLPTPSSLIFVARGTNPALNSTLSQNYPTQMTTLQAYSAGGYDLVVPSTAYAWGSGSALAFLASATGGTSAFVLQTPNGMYKGASSPSVVGGDGGTVGVGGAQQEAGPTIRWVIDQSEIWGSSLCCAFTLDRRCRLAL